ncbi:deoxyuridine 5'-triphosphate nucleotidohydrolase [Achlya hypogyna]|uniref:Deoxyuridine 5'-triphosphate nucleotidohydrolase n=1 Tax=Achlya hypogyna TaxID=1202772 RepID=A0A1V9ZU08_ACHHY|nr:deoxyuridine 5'-triphosphate nucleotidohydrolase [Achlya hypogyna]
MGKETMLVKKLSATAVLPVRGSALAAGFDLASAYECVIPAHGKALVKTDIAIAIPSGCYARVAPRSGLSWKNHLDVGAGVIDEDYRGNVGVVIFNHANEDFQVKAGDRIAQLILERIIAQADVVEVDELSETARGEGGFGSTGVSKRAKTEHAVDEASTTSGADAIVAAIAAVEAELSEAQRKRVKEIVVQADERRFDLLEKTSAQFLATNNKTAFLEWLHALLQ